MNMYTNTFNKIILNNKMIESSYFQTGTHGEVKNFLKIIHRLKVKSLFNVFFF